jgi:hypothetical protein
MYTEETAQLHNNKNKTVRNPFFNSKKTTKKKEEKTNIKPKIKPIKTTKGDN